MSGPHNAGKGTNRRGYDAAAWNNSPFWNNNKLNKQDEHHTGNTEEGILPAPEEGKLPEDTGPDKKA